MPDNDHATTTDSPSGEGNVSGRLAALESELARARERLDESERRRQIQKLVMEAGTVDVDAATMLVEAAIREGAGAAKADQKPDPKPDPRMLPKAVEDLKRRKPVLFRANLRAGGAGAGGGGGGAMGGSVPRPGAELEQAARDAAQSGDRKSLVHYLRLRRASL